MRPLQSKTALFARAQWVLAGFLIIALGGFYFVGYLPMNSKLRGLRQEIEIKRRDLAFSQSKGFDLDRLTRDVEHLQADVERNGKKLPKEPELGQFIADLYQVGQQSALLNFTVEPNASRRFDLFFELPIKMRFEGDFSNAARFLRQVEDLQRLTRVHHLNIKSRPDKDGKEGRVDVEVVMNIYFGD